MQYLKSKNIIYLTILAMIFLTINAIPAFADTQVFNDVLEQLRNDEIIPRVRGQVVSFGNYEDEFAVMEHYQWFPIVNADNFVFSANISWLSSLPATNGSAAGCGVVFGADPLSTDHLMASVRMDGHAYLSGISASQPLRFIDYFFGYPTIQGDVDFVLIVNGDQASIYINGVKLGTRSAIVTYGNAIGLATLAGTNYQFGTRCTWNDIYLYTWE